jgi:hypothetical protein
VILPNTVSFQDATPSITFEEQDGVDKAFLTYEFAGQTVGKASISLEENSEEEFNFSETESNGELSKQNGPKFITINITLIFAVLLGIAALVLIIYLISRLYLKNRAKIRKSINIYQKRKFLKRRRYHRSKKRR